MATQSLQEAMVITLVPACASAHTGWSGQGPFTAPHHNYRMQDAERASALDIMLSSSSPNSSSSFFDGPFPPPPKMPPATSYAVRQEHAQRSRRGQRCADRPRAPLSHLTVRQADCMSQPTAQVLQDLMYVRTAGVSILSFSRCSWDHTCIVAAASCSGSSAWRAVIALCRPSCLQEALSSSICLPKAQRTQSREHNHEAGLALQRLHHHTVPWSCPASMITCIAQTGRGLSLLLLGS